MKMLLYITLLIGSFSSLSFAQSSKKLLLEISNSNSVITVPQGKTWILEGIISDYSTDCVKDGDYYNCSDIYLFVERLNNVEKTNVANFKFGPLLYKSPSNISFQLPVHLLSGTILDMIILAGYVGKMEEYAGSAYLSITEIDE